MPSNYSRQHRNAFAGKGGPPMSRYTAVWNWRMAVRALKSLPTTAPAGLVAMHERSVQDLQNILLQHDAMEGGNI